MASTGNPSSRSRTARAKDFLARIFGGRRRANAGNVGPNFNRPRQQATIAAARAAAATRSAATTRNREPRVSASPATSTKTPSPG